MEVMKVVLKDDYIILHITNHIFSRLLTLNKILLNVKPEDEIEDDMICDVIM